MAATVGPDMPVEPSTAIASNPSDLLLSGGVMAIPKQVVSAPSSPPPNPPFVFPARPDPSTHTPSSTTSSYSRATGRRPKSLVDGLLSGAHPAAEADRPPSRTLVLPEFTFNPSATSPTLDAESAPNPRSPNLPDFKFNPGAGLASPPLEHSFLSPPQSPALAPSSARAIPTRSNGHGHKRGGSEFVGGQIRSGDAITVVSTSPTRSESGFASPQLKPSHPRRGHAHRRSAAISSHDLSVILKPGSPQLRGNSAPSSPAAFERTPEFSFPLEPAEQAQRPDETAVPMTGEHAVQDTVAEPKAEEVEDAKTPPARPAKSARVGFSDTLEFIPRPLSLVSSDASSTATRRPGHSLSGSISSIISLTASAASEPKNMPESQSELEKTLVASSPPRNPTDPRPSTAGAVMERSQSPDLEDERRSPVRRNSIPLLNTSVLATPVSPDTPSPNKAPKRWSFFGLEPFAASTSPTRARPPSSSSTESAEKQISPRTSRDSPGRDACTEARSKADNDSTSHKVTGRKGKKKKKVRAWAGSILPRKSKYRHGKKPHIRRSQTPTPLSPVVGEDDSEDTLDGAEALTPTATMPDMEPEPTDGDDDAWKPRPLSPSEDDSAYPMIDLDAALGPFNTPLPRNAEWEAAQRASGLNRRTLHSAARLSGFSGPGMHYQHRRAESAPEMPPFNRAGIPRFSSNSTMADVFEEDEEDDTKPPGAEDVQMTENWLVSPDHVDTTMEPPKPNIDIRVISDYPSTPLDRASAAVEDGPSSAISSVALSRKNSSLSSIGEDSHETQPTMSVALDHSAKLLNDEDIIEETANGRRFIASDRDSLGSITPSPRRVFKGKDLAPVDVSPLHLPATGLAPVSPYSMTHSSSAFPSPRSPMSYDDGNRISTAPSSVTEDTFQSLLLGEPGPEVRISMDIPSLTSSNSTMTRESAFAQSMQQLSQVPARGERPASFSSPFGRRGSLASIGRLISTSHGERSKLSIEVSIDAEQPEKKAKASRAKRLSRLVQFWKPKETETPK